jgi:CheY-like chemotaxis protein
MSDSATILLAEDREDDIILVQRAFKTGGIPNPLMVVRDGEEAISYLSGVGRYSNRELYPIPALFLLDLTLPVTDGFEVLRWVRSHTDLKDLPVVVLTASDKIRDVNQAYRLGAHSFLVKSLDFLDAIGLAKQISDYWLKLKKNPSAPPPPQHWPPKENLHPPSVPAEYPQPLPDNPPIGTAPPLPPPNGPTLGAAPQ